MCTSHLSWGVFLLVIGWCAVCRSDWIPKDKKKNAPAVHANILLHAYGGICPAQLRAFVTSCNYKVIPCITVMRIITW